MKDRTIVIIGGGFGGLSAARTLQHSDARVILIDRTNHHLFQPLLYQVATAALAPGDIAVPIRSVFRPDDNISVLMGEVTGIDKESKHVTLESGERIAFDQLVVAPGGRHSYFGNPQWEEDAPGLKTLADALYIRERILLSLEKAEREKNLEKRQRYLTFVVVGGGPTGVEVAGSIAEIAKKTMIRDFSRISPADTRIILLEAQSSILTSYDRNLQQRAIKDIERMGISIILETMVTGVDEHGVQTANGFIESSNIIWAAGNAASPLLQTLDVETDRAGRVTVEQDLSLPGYPDVFVIGDAARFVEPSGRELPGIAPVALQQGRHVGKMLKRLLKNGERPAFQYYDKGQMATIGRARAIVEMGGLRLSGFLAWLMWSFIHIFYVIGFRNRFRVMAEWIWYYITFKGGFRLITGVQRRRKASGDASGWQDDAATAKQPERQAGVD